MAATNQIIDKFFNLGNKATKGEPVRKAYFDYCLYWVVFGVFIFLALNYMYSFFFKNGTFGTLCWGLVVAVFSWFNYWGLIAFRQTYLNMKKFYSKPKEDKKLDEKDIFSDEEIKKEEYKHL